MCEPAKRAAAESWARPRATGRYAGFNFIGIAYPGFAAHPGLYAIVRSADWLTVPNILFLNHARCAGNSERKSNDQH